jgi:hypothetical protein
MTPIKPIQIEQRKHIGQLINQYNCKVGVEVGVRHGEMSQLIMDTSNIETLYGIDILRDERAVAMAEKYSPRYKYIVKDSIEAAKDFPNEFFDFIHIDAHHSYRSVYKDLKAWWPKLKHGYIFSGDDYIIQDWHPEGKFMVIEAIERFCERHNQQIYVTGIEGDRAARRAWGQLQGDEIFKWYWHHPNNFQQVPAWYVIKS